MLLRTTWFCGIVASGREGESLAWISFHLVRNKRSNESNKKPVSLPSTLWQELYGSEEYDEGEDMTVSSQYFCAVTEEMDALVDFRHWYHSHFKKELWLQVRNVCITCQRAEKHSLSQTNWQILRSSRKFYHLSRGVHRPFQLHQRA